MAAWQFDSERSYLVRTLRLAKAAQVRSDHSIACRTKRLYLIKPEYLGIITMPAEIIIIKFINAIIVYCLLFQHYVYVCIYI
jgi:hypothetical protein